MWDDCVMLQAHNSVAPKKRKSTSVTITLGLCNWLHTYLVSVLCDIIFPVLHNYRLISPASVTEHNHLSSSPDRRLNGPLDITV